MKHLCHAIGCHEVVPPRMLMCGRHWRMVPFTLQQAVWKNYRRGQEVDKNPSAAYLEVAREAISAVQAKERASGKNPVARPHQLQVHQRTMNL
jgi:hypothetical protein